MKLTPGTSGCSPMSVARALFFFGLLSILGACGVSDRPPAPDRVAQELSDPTPFSVASTVAIPVQLAGKTQAPLDRRSFSAPSGYPFVLSSKQLARAVNDTQKLVAHVDQDAVVRVTPSLSGRDAPAWDVALRLSAIGRPGEMAPAPKVSRGPDVERGSARYQRGHTVEEWFANGPLGFEQGFVLAQPPSPASNSLAPGIVPAPVVLEIEVSGALRPERTDRADAISLRSEDGRAVLHYGGLIAWDADGHALSAWLDVQGTAIAIVLDDRGARYPLTIDPIIWVQEQKLVQDGVGTVNDQLGLSVAVSGDTAIVGAYGNDENGLDAGAAYVFQKVGTSWVQQQKLLPSDGDAGDYFGYSVAIEGDTAIIGAYGDDEAGPEAGAAYVFMRAGGVWTEHKKLNAMGLQSQDYFGVSVAIQGDTALVGAHGDDEKGSMAGAAYIFRQGVGGANEWGQQAKLTADTGVAQDNFGIAVAVDETTAVIGAKGDDDKGSMAGAAYVFVRTGSLWGQQGKLVASDGAPLDQLGTALAVHGDSVVVGAQLANSPAADAGAAYVFVRSGTDWTEEQKLVPAGALVQDYFGCAVAIDGDTVLVGAWGDDETASNAGAAYLYRRTGTDWALSKKVLAGDGVANDWFGIAVALDGPTAVLGATGDDDTGSASGSAYVLGRDEGGVDLWGQEGKLLAPDGLGLEYLGYSLALRGDTAVAGAHGADDQGANTGAAYVFAQTLGTWSQQGRLAALDGAANDRFGFSVDLSGERVVAGAYLHDDVAADAGAAYVFLRSGTAWSQEAKLQASDAAASDNFGVAVAIDGDTAVVGAHLDDDKGSNSGSVYVFQRSAGGWVEQQKLTAGDGVANDQFGRAVAIDGDTIVVGSPNDDDGASNSGSVYVFVRTGTTWAEQGKLSAADPGVNAYLGFSVDVDGDTVFAGAYMDDAGAADSGSAYVFVRNGVTWTQQMKITASDGEENDRFAQSVSVSGDRAILGAYFDDDKGSNSGTAYVFERSGNVWTETQKLTSDDGAANDYFGFAVSLDDTTALVGAYGDDDKGSASGAVYSLSLRKTLAEACVSATECESGNCVDGVCCALSACPDCHSCAASGTEGQCAPMASLAGSACGDVTQSSCTEPDTCDAQGVCQPNHTSAGTSCGSTESTDCTQPDSCDGSGTCLPNHADVGSACGDTSDTECSGPDACNSDGVCAPNHEPDGTVCSGGQCIDGQCVGDGGTGGASGAAGSGGTGGSGGSGGSAGSSGTGGTAGSGGVAGKSGGAASSDSDSDSGCGCRTVGTPTRGGLLVGLLFALAAVSRKRWPARLRHGARLALPAGWLLLVASAAGCGDSKTDLPVPGDSGLGGTGASEAGPGGASGSGGTDTGGTGGATGGTAGTGGNIVCPPEKQCGLSCCNEDEECVENLCLPACPAPRERCGDNPPVCCALDEPCYKGTCVPDCAAPRVPCGPEDDVVCCDSSELCFNSQCVSPGAPCLDFADCDDDEYCEPTVAQCLPAGALPACEYRPPVGEFSPTVEWTYSPITAPYVREPATASATDICQGVGTPLAFANSDEALVVVPLGALEIPFFDKNRNSLVVSTNGWLTLSGNHKDGPVSENTSLLDPTAPDLIVAPYWDDLKNVTACAHVDTAGARVVVQWRGEVAGTGEWVRFQAILNGAAHAEAGVVQFVYLQLGATQNGDGATVGIAEKSTKRAVLHGLNRNGAVSTTSALRFRYVPLRNRFDALAPPAVFDLDGDGRPEVIFAAYDDTPTSSGVPNDTIYDLHSGVLTILNGEDGTIQARPLETPGYDGYLGAGVALSVGDIDGDGQVEIVGVGRLEPMVNSPPYVKAFRADGTLLWVSDFDVGFNHSGWGGGIHLADLDGDGRAEIFFALSVFNHEGIRIWSKPQEYGSPATTAADLDGDGDLEIVSDRSAWHHDGTPMWQRPDLTGFHFPSIADFDLDGEPEVALVSNGAVIILHGHDGSTFWGPVSLQTDGGGPLNIGDFDGDGYPEIGTAGEGLYLVLDMQCTGDPLPSGCDREGVRWSSPTKDISSNVTGSSLFDFEGDGFAEVVYSDECFTRVYSGADGQVLFESSVNTRTATEYPLVADVDGDNNAEILVVANENVVGCNAAPWNVGHLGTPWQQADYPPPFCATSICGHRGLAVYGDAMDNWVRTRRVWSGHAYHITNVLTSGVVPPQEEPNWLNPRYNNFRMNAQGSALFSAPDLEVDLEADTLVCPAKLRLRARVSNSGALGVAPGVDVAFYKKITGGWQCLGVVQTSEDLLPGNTTDVTLDYVLDNEINKTIEFRAVVDSDCDGASKHNECETGGEDNNEDTASGLCTSVTPPA